MKYSFHPSARFERFPYGVIYQISEDEVLIVAIMQLNRKPNYWQSRIK